MTTMMTMRQVSGRIVIVTATAIMTSLSSASDRATSDFASAFTSVEGVSGAHPLQVLEQCSCAKDLLQRPRARYSLQVDSDKLSTLPAHGYVVALVVTSHPGQDVLFDVDLVLEGSRVRPTLFLALSVIRPVCASVKVLFRVADIAVATLA